MKLPWRLLRALCALAMTVTVAAAKEPDASSYEARVAVPVADLRKEPSGPGLSRDHDPLEESQLLYGDRVQVLEEKNGWARVAVPGQMEWTRHHRWEGYPGWVRLPDLARDNTTTEPPAANGGGQETTSAGARRKAIVQAARKFIGTPYYWGGRSPYDPKAKAPPHRGVDCSGLVGLAYQMNGIRIPRDAHEQWMKARPITRAMLQPADLIFLSDPKDPRKILHVMLYAGGGRVIEGPGTGENIREIEMEPRLKKSLATGRRAYYGSYFLEE